MIFGLFKRKRRGSSSIRDAMPADQQDAFDKGRDLGSAVVKDIEDYITSRASQIRSGYLNVFQTQLETARTQIEYSPILASREDYRLFIEHSKKAEESLVAETMLYSERWKDVTDMLAIEDMRPKLIAKLVADHLGSLTLEGLQQLVENADRLKEADNKWREQYPKLAASQTLD